MTLQSCDTMVAPPATTAHGQTVFAKNSDRPADECQPLELHVRVEHPVGASTKCQFVTLPETKVSWRHVGSRPWWCWGYEHGFNEHQVVIGNEALDSHDLEPATGSKLIGMEILRMGLERGRTAREAVQVMTDAISLYGQGEFRNDAGVPTYDNGYIVADPSEAFVIETAGHHWAVKRVEDALGISNVYSITTDYEAVSEEADRFASDLGAHQSGSPFDFARAFRRREGPKGNGASRRSRSCSLLSASRGSIDVRTMISILSDHSDGAVPEEELQTRVRGGGLCCHFGNGKNVNTAASLVADLCADGSRLPVYWCSFYSPCLGLFFPVFIQGQLPEVLSISSENRDETSPWWKFHRLAHLLGGEENRVTTVRQQWARQQESCFIQAYDIAREGRDLIDAGNPGQAERRLAAFMQETVDRMLKTVDELTARFAGVSSGA